MARALLLALACAGALVAAAGASYGDYFGAKMPQYGAVDYDARAAAPPADDYRNQSPDAPAPLDYKYDEVSSDKIDKSIPHDSEADDSRNKPVQKLRSDKFIDREDPEALNEYKLDEVIPKFQNKYRAKHKARYRNINKLRTEEVLSRRISPGREEQQMHLDDDEDTQLYRRDFDNRFELEDERRKFVTRDIRPKIRRKPRDRPNVNANLKTHEDEEKMSAIRDIQQSLRGGHDYSKIEERPQANVAAEVGQRFRGGSPAREDEDDIATSIPERKQKPVKSYNDYADYYDMKKVQDIKKKMPAIQRRTQARGTAPLASRRFVASMRTRRPTQRRKTDATTVAPTSPATTTTAASIRNRSGESVSFGQVAPRSQDLSLAEKSRLSILNKAQRKESSRNRTSTDKPPVLLQVTQKLHTVVVVEPPVHQDPWLRAKEVSDDTPERLEEVKRLMRHKLAATAKDIRDLTDNWNDVICDYVDVGMLDRSDAFIKTLNIDTLLFLTLPAVLELF